MPTKEWTTTGEFNTGTSVGLKTTGDELSLITGSATARLTINTATGSTVTTFSWAGQSIVPTADITINAVDIGISFTAVATTSRIVRIETWGTDCPTGTLAFTGAVGCAVITAGDGLYRAYLDNSGVLSSGKTYFISTWYDTADKTGLQGTTDSTSYTAGRLYWKNTVSNGWGPASSDMAGSLLFAVETATSGIWTVDMDSSGNATWGNIDCNSVGGDVQIRLKTAANQAGLGAAAWVPATGYYTSFPAAGTAVQNQWLRIEVSLSGGATVQDVEQSYEFITAMIDYQGTLSLGMQRKLIL